MWGLSGAQFTIPPMGQDRPQPFTFVCPPILIEHDKGLVLFDTGCHPRIMDDIVGYWGDFWKMMEVKFSPADKLDTQIKGLGYKLDDVKYVVLSHLHLDHTGGMTLFPNAKFLVGANEIRFAYWADPQQRSFFLMDDLVPTRAYNWLEVGQDYDLFGDGSIQMLSTPGHTPGECTLLVTLPSRKFVLTGDTVHTRQDLAEEKAMVIDYDPAQAVASLKRLKRLRDEHQATIWIPHDIDDWNDLPHAPKAIE
jgi:glyoxylase-like metal-dependent hydrolase (beta-lactamase superfamily II)